MLSSFSPALLAEAQAIRDRAHHRMHRDAMVGRRVGARVLASGIPSVLSELSILAYSTTVHLAWCLDLQMGKALPQVWSLPAICSYTALKQRCLPVYVGPGHCQFSQPVHDNLCIQALMRLYRPSLLQAAG